MNEDFLSALKRASRSLGTGKLEEATRTLQQALTPDSAGSTPRAPRMRSPLGDVLKSLNGLRQMPAAPHGPGTPALRRDRDPLPEGAQFVSRTYSGPQGTREFRLYIPSGPPRGLILMLHGCKQDGDDFAAGTHMNAVAEQHGLVVAYPIQPMSANPSSCWNWFSPAHQDRGAGEPAILAGLTTDLIREFGITPGNTFVAGLSAGGAMAMVMAQTYPGLFAAAGVHSGLAYRSANDVMSALAVMRGDRAAPSPVSRRSSGGMPPRLIVFQGSADATVHAANADRIVEAGMDSISGLQKQIQMHSGVAAGGRKYNRTVIESQTGRPLIEDWRIQGAGHAWSGGTAKGSYTDPSGPDASAEMVRFFLK